jgi:ubiquinone/menaquinone biosynthesis C-methylase UbiE
MDQISGQIGACYDAVARTYAERFADELAHKPLDRELLTRFASLVNSDGAVHDLGCGPGQTTAFLCACGVKVLGLDISAEMVREARRRHPHIAFKQGDMLTLAVPTASVAGVVAFYAIVHFSEAQLRQALGEMYRVLQPGGRLMLAFHIGQGTIHVEEFLGHAVALDFVFLAVPAVKELVAHIGFTDIEVIERDPYPEIEYQSRRAYLIARRPVAE